MMKTHDQKPSGLAMPLVSALHSGGTLILLRMAWGDSRLLLAFPATDRLLSDIRTRCPCLART